MTQCIIFGIAYWMLAVVGYLMCVSSMVILVLDDQKPKEKQMDDILSMTLIIAVVIGFVLLLGGISPYLPCIQVVAFV